MADDIPVKVRIKLSIIISVSGVSRSVYIDMRLVGGVTTSRVRKLGFAVSLPVLETHEDICGYEAPTKTSSGGGVHWCELGLIPRVMLMLDWRNLERTILRRRGFRVEVSHLDAISNLTRYGYINSILARYVPDSNEPI